MVVIRPDDDHTSKGDILLSDTVMETTVKGTVVSFIDRPCNYDKVHKLMRRGGFIRKQRANFLTRRSKEFGVELGIKEGDRVFFSYLSRFEITVDGYWIIPESYLICKESLEPLNGYILFQVSEHKDDGWFKYYYEDVNQYGKGIVKHVGKKTAYLDYPVKPDVLDVEVGDEIMYNRKQAVRLEVDMFNTTTNNQSSLFRIHRNHIWLRS